MAFNPFHAFRKHQKVFFAGLTIMCMVTFVLAGSMTANWDFFHEILRWFGGGKSRGMELAKLYGKTYNEQEIRQVQQQRQVAAQFMIGAVDEAMRGTQIKQSEIVKELKKSEAPGLKLQIDQLVQMAGMFGMQQSPQLFQRIDFLEAGLKNDKRGREVQLLEEFKGVLEAQSVLLTKFFQARGSYFGGSFSIQGVLDFLIWKRQADHLGIQLTDADVNDLVRRETLGQLTPNGSLAILQKIKNQYGGNLGNRAMIQSALKDEFRVRLAQKAILGLESSQFNRTPEPVTPYEFWRFYRDQRHEKWVAVLPIPVGHKDFLAKVPEPTKEELKDFFEANKEREYDPKIAKAAFKQPARFQVGWVSARPDSPEIRKEVEDAAKKKQEELLRASAVAAFGGARPVPILSSSLPFFAKEIPLIDVYESEKREQYRTPSLIEPLGKSLLESSLQNPEAIASTIGLMAGPGNRGTGLSLTLGYWGAAYQAEVRDRIKADCALFATGAVAPIDYPWPISALKFPEIVLFSMKPKNEFLPMHEVKDRLVKKIEENQAEKQVRTVMNDLRTYLETHSKDKPEDVRKAQSIDRADTIAATIGEAAGNLAAPFSVPVSLFGQGSTHELADKAKVAGSLIGASLTSNPVYAGLPVQRVIPLVTQAVWSIEEKRLPQRTIEKYLATYIQKHGLKRGGSSRFVDRYNLAEDPGMKPLKDASLRLSGFSNPTKDDQQFTDELSRALSQESTLYYPNDLVAAFQNPEKFLYWKSADKAPYVPSSWEEITDKVRERWKFEKARQFAKEEAEKVAEAARKAKGPDFIRNLKEGSPHSEKMFELPGVARLVKHSDLEAVPSRLEKPAFKAYQVPEDRVKYPSEDFVDKLLSLKEDGDVLVLHDKPEGHYYVVGLISSFKADEREFFADYGDPTKEKSLLTNLGEETKYRDHYREAVMKTLQDEADYWITSNKDDLKAVEERRGSDE